MSNATESWSQLGPGEHVCWQVSSPQEYAQGQRDLIAHTARSGARLLIVGSPVDDAHDAGAVRVLDYASDAPSTRSPGVVLHVVRREVHEARRSGQKVRVLAGMDHFARPQQSLDELITHEMDLGELATHGGTSVVCAYSRMVWNPGVIQDLTAVHSRVIGLQPRTAVFRLTRADAESWWLEGTVGLESLRAFSAAVRGALVRTPRARLRCAGLDLIDAAAWRALVEAVVQARGGSLVLEGANETVRATWRMSGYAGYGAAIEVHA